MSFRKRVSAKPTVNEYLSRIYFGMTPFLSNPFISIPIFYLYPPLQNHSYQPTLINTMRAAPHLLFLFLLSLFTSQCTSPDEPALPITKDTHILLIGNNLCSRMMNFGHFETELHLRYPDSNLFIRNMCDGGNTPGFRPHSGRVSPWAFPGAEVFNPSVAQNSNSQGHFETEDEWLTRMKADIIIACFGYSGSFAGEADWRISKRNCRRLSAIHLNKNTMGWLLRN